MYGVIKTLLPLAGGGPAFVAQVSGIYFVQAVAVATAVGEEHVVAGAPSRDHKHENGCAGISPKAAFFVESCVLRGKLLSSWKAAFSPESCVLPGKLSTINLEGPEFDNLDKAPLAPRSIAT